MRPAKLYQGPLAKLEEQLAEAIASGCAQHPGPIALFWRADDIGYPSASFSALIQAFQHHAMPLCLATVPSWLTADSLHQLRRVTGYDDDQWCWHQHGRSHRNYETIGKKQEFGPARTEAAIRGDIHQGKARLKTLLGGAFQPFFTPPWNRCSQETLTILEEEGFKGISRYRGALPPSPATLPDIAMNIDLHTSRAESQEEAWQQLRRELVAGLASGHCGIMLHHQRMNHHALNLLHILLRLLAAAPQISPRLFSTRIP